MQVWAGQRLGAITVLMAALAVYGITVLMAHLPHRQVPLPWGDQRPGMAAVELTGDGGGEGIYFFPEEMRLSEILKGAGTAINIDMTGLADDVFYGGSAITITVDHGVLKVTDMPSAKRLALGLPVNLNLASEEELSLIPGIGSRTAAKIVQLRQTRGKFQMIDDLIEVPGIGKNKLNSIKKYLTIGRIH